MNGITAYNPYQDRFNYIVGEELSSLEKVAVVGLGVCSIPFVLVGGTALALALGVNKLVEEGKRVYYINIRHKQVIVEDEMSAFPHYRIIGN
jgi:hypothetical protein